MTYKTITACVVRHELDHDTLMAAAAMADRFSAHLTVLCLGVDRTNPGAYYAGAEAIALQANLQLAQDEAVAAESDATKALGPWSVSWETQALTAQIGALGPLIGERTILSDLVILPKPYGEGRGVENVVIIEATLFRTRVPVLVLPEGMEEAVTPKKVVIAWNDSPEALAAVRGAMPLLTQAESVNVAIFDPPQHTPDRSDPGGALAQMLSRNGVRADISVLPKTMPRISEVLARHCEDQNADLLVMGAYGHSRLREAILGGATRNTLEMAELPVLMAH